jgi:hypothetical protein
MAASTRCPKSSKENHGNAGKFHISLLEKENMHKKAMTA